MPVFPVELQNLLTGPVRVLYAPITEPVAADLSDIIDLESPHDPAGTYEDLGATNDETEYSRDMDSEELFIEQSTAAVLSRITEVTRQLTVPMAEFTPTTQRLAEEGSAEVAIAAAAGKSAQKAIDIGSIESLTRYRVAFIAMRDPGLGAVVTDSNGVVRGPFVGFAAHAAAIAAEESAFSLSKEDLSGRELVFGFAGDPAIADPKKNTGRFLFEEPGVIAA